MKKDGVFFLCQDPNENKIHNNLDEKKDGVFFLCQDPNKIKIHEIL
jgi:hypothetical protein